MRSILELMRDRHSERAAYDPGRRIAAQDLLQILEAARWAPTAHNMQNFHIIVVDDRATLAEIGAIRRDVSAVFLRENYQQLSFSEEELLRKRTGVLASMFPPSWRNPDAGTAVAAAAESGPLRESMRDCTALLIVFYDQRMRAPASEGDVLGIMSLGCVMQNLWLAAVDLGISMQILSALSGETIERELRRILAPPPQLKIAFACRIGYPAVPAARYLRVRREVADFVHYNRYGNRIRLADGG
jgi:nitroreductase